MRFLATVTGTDGKTSTVEFARHLLVAGFDRPVGVGSLGAIDVDGRWPVPFFLSRPGAWRRYVDELALDYDAAVLEAFSSGLALHEWDDTDPDVAVCTTFGADHRDVHGGTAAYARAKLRLFDTVLPPGGYAIVHADNPLRGRIERIAAARSHHVVVYGSDGDVRLVGREPVADGGARLVIDVGGRRAEVLTPLGAAFLVDNQLAAVAIAVTAGIAPASAVSRLADVVAPPGRWQVVAASNGRTGVVDHAHTPNALAAALSAARERAPGRVIVVFGAGGDRDPGKRTALGSIAGQLADTVIVTDDNPRSEDPAAIRATVLAGCPGAIEIADRTAAVHEAVAMLGSGDIVVVAGRGAEAHQEVAGQHRPLDDRTLLDRALDRFTPAPGPAAAPDAAGRG